MLNLELLAWGKSEKAPAPVELQPSVGYTPSLNSYSDRKKHSSIDMH